MLAAARMQIQDTPGYGDDLNLNTNIDRIKKHVQEQNSKWHEFESHAKRGELEKAVDPRVDLCIFCLAPHRVRNIDLLFMHEVSKVRLFPLYVQPHAATDLCSALAAQWAHVHAPRGPSCCLLLQQAVVTPDVAAGAISRCSSMTSTSSAHNRCHDLQLVCT